jgi:hypothetical protein
LACRARRLGTNAGGVGDGDEPTFVHHLERARWRSIRASGRRSHKALDSLGILAHGETPPRQRIQNGASGRTFNRAYPIGSPHRTHSPYVLASILPKAC